MAPLLGLLATLAGGALLLGARPAPTEAEVEATSAPARAPLPPLARSLLQRRMAQHAQAMGGFDGLVNSVLLLHYDQARVAAERLLEQPDWAGPEAAGTGDLNAEVPAEFFAYQRELRAAIREVSEAAAHHRPDALARSFGRMTSACVACHASYLPPTAGASPARP
jgi:cytochrome c556